MKRAMGRMMKTCGRALIREEAQRNLVYYSVEAVARIEGSLEKRRKKQSVHTSQRTVCFCCVQMFIIV